MAKKAHDHTIANYGYKAAIKNANNTLSLLKSKLVAAEIHPFDKTLNGENPEVCNTSLVTHRIVNKFNMTTSAAELRSKAFQKYVTEDEALGVCVSGFNIWSEGLDSYYLRKMQLNLRRIFRNFNLNLKKASIAFSPGETFISSRGDVSVLAKLSEREHWTTYDSCLHDTCVLIYHNMSLKRAAKELIGPVTRKERRAYYARAIDQGYSKGELGFVVFHWLLEDKLLTVVKGSRGSSVPKDSEVDRFINVEAMFPCILQMIVGSEIKRCLRRNGNFLLPIKSESECFPKNGVTMVKRTLSHIGLEAQNHHGHLISNPKYATLDFKSASNSVSKVVVFSTFPKVVVSYLQRYRSGYVQLGNEWYEPNMLSSMGNGFTFEVMSAMLYALGCVFSPDVRVFGDDVIIPNTVARVFARVAAAVGFNLNEKKSFIDSNFRESCGYFYHDDFGYLTSFDFTQCETFQDVILTCNKLTLLLAEANIPSIYGLLEEARDSIRSTILSSNKGPIPSPDNQIKNLGLYVWDENWLRKHTKSSSHKEARSKALRKVKPYFSDMQVGISQLAFVSIPFFVNRTSKNKSTRYAKYGATLYTGMSVKRHISGRGRWVNLWAFVEPDGSITLLRYATSRLNCRIVSLVDSNVRRPNIREVMN